MFFHRIYHHPFLSHTDTYEGVKVDAPGCLIETICLFNKGEFSIGKVKWLEQFQQFDFSVSNILDVWEVNRTCLCQPRALFYAVDKKSVCNALSCTWKVGITGAKHVFLVNSAVSAKPT